MIAKLTYVWCEVEDCDEEVGPNVNAAEARQAAKEAGWSYGAGGQDFCPKHRGNA